MYKGYNWLEFVIPKMAKISEALKTQYTRRGTLSVSSSFGLFGETCINQREV